MAAHARTRNQTSTCANVPTAFPALIAKWWTTSAPRLLVSTAALAPSPSTHHLTVPVRQDGLEPLAKLVSLYRSQFFFVFFFSEFYFFNKNKKGI